MEGARPLDRRSGSELTIVFACDVAALPSSGAGTANGLLSNSRMSNSGEGVTRHSRDAHCARVMHRSRPHQEEGTGNAGAANAPAALRATRKARKQVTTGTPKRRHSLRNGLTAYTCSPWCTGLFSHHRSAIRLAELDPSVGRSGPHDFAVRARHRSPGDTGTSTASCFNVCGDWRNAPLHESGCAQISILFGKTEEKFLSDGTGVADQPEGPKEIGLFEFPGASRFPGQ